MESPEDSPLPTMDSPLLLPPEDTWNLIAGTTPLTVTPIMNQPSQSFECCLKSCPLGHSQDRMTCFVTKCNKKINWHCYICLVLEGQCKGTETKTNFMEGNQNVAVCSHWHLKQAAAASKKSPVDENVGWTEDGLRVPEDPNMSEGMLLDWITTDGNYRVYRGETKDF
jgi:hypothetical protein